MILSKEAIFAANDMAERREVQIPEWGGSVYVRKISALEADRFETSLQKRTGKTVETNLGGGGIRARFAALVCCDDKGERLFTDAEAVELAKHSRSALDRVWEAGRELNRMDAEDGEAEKNCETTPVG